MGIYEDIQVGIFLELLGPFFFFLLYSRNYTSLNLPKVLFSFPFVSLMYECLLL